MTDASTTPEQSPHRDASIAASKSKADSRFLRVLNGETVDRPPFWFMRQAGRYLPEYRDIRAQTGSFLDLCYTPKKACEVTLQPIRRYGMDAAILFSDILVIPDALGQNVTFVTGEGPKLDPIRSGEALAMLSIDNVESHLEPVFETIDRLSSALDSKTALIGFAGAPWTVATYMVEGGSSKDFATIKAWAFREPDAVDRLIELVTEATARYLCRQIDAGAQVIQLFDTWAGVLPEEAVERWVIQPTRRLVDRIRAHRADIPIIGFPRQLGALTPTYCERTGISAVSLDTSVDLNFAAALQENTVIQGNLDPILLTVGGEAMKTAARRRLDRLGNQRYVFNLGHGITPAASPEIVSELSALIRDWPAR